MKALSFLAHDIRNIAATISLDAEMMTQSKSPRQKEIGLRTLQRIDRMVTICEAAISNGAPANLDVSNTQDSYILAEVLFDIIMSLTQPKSQAEVSIECALELEVNVCQTRLFRALLNIVGNAITAAGGKEDGRVQISAFHTLNTTEINVIDNGPGLPKGVIERFHSGMPAPHCAASTHGLGLLIARQMTLELGGRLDIIRTSPAGSHFCLSLPRKSEAPDFDRKPLQLVTVNGNAVYM